MSGSDDTRHTKLVVNPDNAPEQVNEEVQREPGDVSPSSYLNLDGGNEVSDVIIIT